MRTELFRLADRLEGGADPDFDRDVLSEWRVRGRPIIERNSEYFETLLQQVRQFMDRGRYAEAAERAQIAASFACLWHPGRFASATLENDLQEIGARTMADPGPSVATGSGTGMRILHVATQVGQIGGHVRMLRRWIKEDPANSHSLALTRQFEAVPHELFEAIAAAGGSVHLINHARGSYLAWARSLQRQMRQSDLIVLHVHVMDILPCLALGGLSDRPPVIYVNHADHLFWVGVAAADSVVNTRQSGGDLCTSRRGIAVERNLNLPLCLEPIEVSRSKRASKEALGIPADSILLLSIARGVKYREFGAMSYADLMLPVLRKHPNARLVVIGPGDLVDWSEASAAVSGRISVLPETPDTRAYLEAADIYVDSFPFPSNTSLFEAGLFGLPLVSFFPFGAGCEVMGADSFGFDTSILRPTSRQMFDATLSSLIADSHARIEGGQRTNRLIRETNMGPNWKSEIQRIYARTLSLHGTDRGAMPEAVPQSEISDIDLFQPFTFGHVSPDHSLSDCLSDIKEFEIRARPLSQRIAYMAKRVASSDSRMSERISSFRYLFPEWALRRAQSALRSLK